MRTFVVLVVLAVCAAGAFSSILEEQHKEKLRQIRNVCVRESGISPYEIGIAKRAIGPAKKLVRASHCIVRRLSEQKDDEIVKEIVERTKYAIEHSNLSKVIARALDVCGNLLGKDACDKVLEVAGLVVENAKKAQLRQA